MSTRKPVKPEVTDLQKGGVELRHPAFATLGFSNVQHGGGIDLFGANVRPRDTVVMRVTRAHMQSDSVDRIYEDEVIVEAELSASQFAQAISQLNRGTGTPVTLRLAPEAGVRPVPYPMIAPVDVVERIKGNTARRLKDEGERLKAAFAKVAAIAEAEGAIPKKALKEAMGHLGSLIGNMPGNLDYYNDLMAEDIEKLVDEGRAQLHAEAQHMSLQAGISVVKIGREGN